MDSACRRNLSLRLSVLVMVATGCLSACTSGSSTAGTVSSASLASDAARRSASEAAQFYCANLSGASAQVSSALANTSPSANQKPVLDTVIAKLRGVQVGAPSQIAATLADLINAFTSAETLLAHPRTADQREMKRVGTRLSVDGKALDAYLARGC